MKIESAILKNLIVSDTCPKCGDVTGVMVMVEVGPPDFQEGPRRIGWEKEIEMDCIDYDRVKAVECGHHWTLVLRLGLERKDE